MAERLKEISKTRASDLIVTSIGACVAMPTNKKQPPVLVIAYRTQSDGEVTFISVGLPKKDKLYTREDLFGFIKDAENVKNVTYVDGKGCTKDVYFCRHASGSIVDVIQRDFEKNRYLDGFAEVTASGLKFSATVSSDSVFKSGKPFYLDVMLSSESKFIKDSYEYALVNAFNACALGTLFDCEELQVETREGQRVKIEVRSVVSSVIEENVLYIKPVYAQSQDVVEHYVTEEFNFIDGESISTRTYEIAYSNRFKSYRLSRV